MPDNDEFKIQLRVADKVYPIFCKRSEEGLFRKAATAINDKILQYSSRFSGTKLELKDLLTMAAIHISVENLLLKQKEDTSPLWDRIELLDKELEEYLQAIQSFA
ncbi:MAG: cell division protein ZapA [Candidatus Azobacteroides sp.]|nr:cell division protein ZapA [Candidatus Azobacteroides sp.]